MKPETRLLLVRHGEPEETSRGRCYGRLDVGLSSRGREQIRATARRLGAVDLAAMYCSPRRRAFESAQILFAGRGEPRVDTRLAEMDFGTLEGLTYEEAALRHPDLYRRWMEAPTDVDFPGGESFAVLRGRVAAATADLLARHRGATIAIVSHGGVNRAILADVLGLPPANIFRLAQDYAAVTVIDYVEDVPIVRASNVALWAAPPLSC